MDFLPIFQITRKKDEVFKGKELFDRLLGVLFAANQAPEKSPFAFFVHTR